MSSKLTPINLHQSTKERFLSLCGKHPKNQELTLENFRIREDQPLDLLPEIRRARIVRLTIHEISDSKLKILARGSPSSNTLLRDYHGLAYFVEYLWNWNNYIE